MPGESYWPLVLAFGLTGIFAGILINDIPIALGGVLIAAVALLGWL